MKKGNRNKTGGLLLITILLFCTACERQGPMGPEGPQGPDGENTGGGEAGAATNVLTFTTNPGATFKWRFSDGWGGYTNSELEISGGGFALPDSVLPVIDQGAIQVYIISSEDDQWKLPRIIGNNKEEIYHFSILEKTLFVFVKTKNLPNGESVDPSLEVKKIKVVLTRPSAVKTLVL